MLSIPESVKALFKTDGVRKNFRAHFPNGEMSDITNADVVKESLHFTESACSQNTFKFGLTEASLIEFETVGRQNMKGMTIECGIEIDTSSLSVAQISAIENDEGDGTLVLAADSDIGYGYYRVPLGVFRVEACPRNQESMTHRRVKAYGELSPYNPFETAKLNTYVPETDYKPNAYLLTLEMLGWQNKAGILAQGFTEQTITTWQPLSDQMYITLDKTSRLKDSGGNDLTFWTSVEFRYGIYQSAPSTSYATDTDMLYAADLNGEDYSEIINAMITALQSTSIDLAESGYASWEDLLTDIFLQDLTGTPYLRPGVVYEGTGRLDEDEAPRGTLCPITGNNDAIYPYIGASVNKNNFPIMQARFFLPMVFSIYDTTGGFTKIYRESVTPATVTAYIPTATVPILTLAVGETANQVLRGHRNYTAYAHGGNFEPEKIPEGLLEFRGMFARLDRTGMLDMFALDPTPMLSVVPGDYMECWWDEYDVSPIGTVLIAYLNGEEGETEAEVSLSTGRSIYDMRDNAVLKSLAAANAGTISVYLGRDFKTHAAATGFTPTEMTMQGWPWMEAGDALRITAEDSATIDTFVLQIDISGIQDLRAEILSQGGEIIQEV